MEDFKRVRTNDGTYEWESENFRIIREGGTDRRGHYSYDLGYYGLVDWNGELWGWFRTLREAKDYTRTLGY